MVGFIADLVGLEAAGRLDGVFLSCNVDEVIVERLSVDGTDFGAGDLADVVAAIETLFADGFVTGFLLPSSGTGEGFVLPSIELVDNLDLCPALAAVAAFTACAGFRGTTPGAGRVGGLLKLLPVVVRDVEDAVALVAGVGAEFKGRFAVVRGRFGGIPLLRGETGASRWFTFGCRESAVVGRGSWLEGISASFSSAGGVSSGGSSSTSAIDSELRYNFRQMASQKLRGMDDEPECTKT